MRSIQAAGNLPPGTIPIGRSSPNGFRALHSHRRRNSRPGGKESYCAETRLPIAGVAALLAASGITSVLLRFGTSPTGMTLVTFMAAVSTTDTERMPEFDT